VLEKSQYIQRALDDHLLSKTHYKQISEQEAMEIRATAYYDILALTILDPFQGELNDDDRLYFKRALCTHRCNGPLVPPPTKTRRIPNFYITPKIHKTPWKTRPVVACVGSVNEVLSKWLDTQLQRVIHLCPSRLKDSDTLISLLQQLPKLPPTAYFTTVDAVSMYTNIDIDHAIESIGLWLELHSDELPKNYPVATILKGLAIVMKTNVFNFGDTYWLQ